MKSEDVYADRIVTREFSGSRGHGGAPITRRVIRPKQLKWMIKEAFLAGRNNTRFGTSKFAAGFSAGPMENPPNEYAR